MRDSRGSRREQLGIHIDSKGSRRESMCSMIWGFKCSRADAKGQTWKEMVRKKREKKRQETGERSQGLQA